MAVVNSAGRMVVSTGALYLLFSLFSAVVWGAQCFQAKIPELEPGWELLHI